MFNALVGFPKVKEDLAQITVGSVIWVLLVIVGLIISFFVYWSTFVASKIFSLPTLGWKTTTPISFAMFSWLCIVKLLNRISPA